MSVAKLASRNLLNGANAGRHGHLCIAHGLFGNAMNWATSTRYIAASSPLKDRLGSVLSVDMRNHGASPHMPSHTNADLAGDLEHFTVSRQTQLGAADKQVLIGHSMGGLALIGMLLRRYNEDTLLQSFAGDNASRFPGWAERDQRESSASMRAVNKELGFSETYPLRKTLFAEGTSTPNGAVTAAVVVDITPTAVMTSEVRESVEAMCRVELNRVHSYDDAQKELTRAGLDNKDLRDFFTTNIVIGRDGSPSRWRCNLPVLASHLDRFQSTIAQWFLQYQQTPQGFAPTPCTLPVLFVFGETSYFNGEARKMIPLFFPNATQAVVPLAGHFVHHEKPREFADIVSSFIAAHL